MRKFLKWMGWGSLALLLMSLVVGSLLLGVALEHVPDAGSWQVIVDGDEAWSSDAGQWVGLHGDHGPLAWLAAALACGFTVLVVVPLALMLGIGLPMLVLLTVFGGLGLLFAGLSLAAMAPILLPLLLVWWLVKRNRKAPLAQS